MPTEIERALVAHYLYLQRRRLFLLLRWRLETTAYAHVWERFDTFFSRCAICGWGWKWDADNDLPCPGRPPDA